MPVCDSEPVPATKRRESNVTNVKAAMRADFALLCALRQNNWPDPHYDTRQGFTPLRAVNLAPTPVFPRRKSCISLK